MWESWRPSFLCSWPHYWYGTPLYFPRRRVWTQSSHCRLLVSQRDFFFLETISQGVCYGRLFVLTSSSIFLFEETVAYWFIPVAFATPCHYFFGGYVCHLLECSFNNFVWSLRSCWLPKSWRSSILWPIDLNIFCFIFVPLLSKKERINFLSQRLPFLTMYSLSFTSWCKPLSLVLYLQRLIPKSWSSLPNHIDPNMADVKKDQKEQPDKDQGKSKSELGLLDEDDEFEEFPVEGEYQQFKFVRPWFVRSNYQTKFFALQSGVLRRRTRKISTYGKIIGTTTRQRTTSASNWSKTWHLFSSHDALFAPWLIQSPCLF